MHQNQKAKLLLIRKNNEELKMILLKQAFKS